VLRRAAIQSPNFLTSVQGWSVNQDGTAEFNSIIIRNGQIISGTSLFYSGTPGPNKLIRAISSVDGTDSFGNRYYAGDTFYNAFGAVVNLVSLTKSAFFQYFNNNSAVQGGLILAVASATDTDPVNGTGYDAGMNGIDPAFGDFLRAVGATINLGQANYTRNAMVSAHSAAMNSANPNVRLDAPEQGTATHMQMLLQGTSPDGTSLGQIIVGLVAGAGALTPVTNAMMEVQGVAGVPDSAVQIAAHAAGDNSFGIRVAGDSSNRFRVDSNGQVSWGTGAGASDVVLARLSSNILSLTLADFRIATIGKGLRVIEGTNAKQGIATLAAGTVTVANTSVTANSRIFLTAQTLGTVTVPSA
jgi:hypothetical protein